MRKILSAALALVCIWFATPAMANCNLFDSSWLLNINEWTESNGVYSGPTWRLILYINNNNGLPVTIDPNTQYTISATFGNNDSSFRFGAKYTDGTTEYQIGNINNGRFSFTTTAGKQVASLTATYGSGASNVELSNIQIERGDTATAYTPYNPLCATCDGTIVNYVSATGTVSQNGTPTPTNPIEPVFYQQGNMVLRKVGNYADSYDASTGKITRRITQTIFDGTEDWYMIDEGDNLLSFSTDFVLKPLGTASSGTAVSNYFKYKYANEYGNLYFSQYRYLFVVSNNFVSSVEGWKQFLAQQYAAGTPVTVWYPLRTETTEDWAATQCLQNIRVATTKYNETAFSPLNTALQNAISVVDTVVSNTITQAASIATLQAQKQTRPNDIADDNEKCPAGKKCLLVEDASGVPHWYEIVENAWDLPVGYTQLQYIESTGTQYIDTGVKPNDVDYIIADFQYTNTELIPSAIMAATGSNIYNYFGEHTAFRGFGENWGNSSTWKTFDIAHNTNRHIWKVDLSNSSEGIVKFYLDENLVTTQTSAQNSDANFTISSLAFASLRSTTGKYYSVKFEKNNALIRDFVPALNTDGKIGMYDLVRGQFYENAGTGTFIGGQPVFN